MTKSGKQRIDTEVRIRYDRPGFETANHHHVRGSIEAAVCAWLMKHHIAHRHASEVFTIVRKNKMPEIFVPDIILHDKLDDGRGVVIEPVQAGAPKGGGSRLLAAFRKQLGEQYFVIVVARRSTRHKLVRGSFDTLVAFENLGMLAKKIPHPPDE